MNNLENSKSSLDEKFDDLKKIQTEKKKQVLLLREMFDRIKVLQNKKSEIVGFIKKIKEERSKTQEAVKKSSGALKNVLDKKKDFGVSESFGALSKRIDNIEWKIWTEVLPYKKEEELVKVRKELESQLEKAKEKESFSKEEHKIRKKIDEVIKEQKLLHSTILSYSKEWEIYNSELKKIFPEIEQKKKKLDELSLKINSIKEEISGIKGSAFLERENLKKQKKKQEHRIAEVNERKINKKVEEIREKFKKGMKLTTEDLVVLSGSGRDII